jgi:hypothetical protein
MKQSVDIKTHSQYDALIQLIVAHLTCDITTLENNENCKIQALLVQ